MIHEFERRLDRADGGDAGWLAALDHDDLDAQRPGRGDLAICGAAAGILADDDVDALVLQQLPLIRFGEWAACENVAAVGNGERWIDRVDAADEVAVLRHGGKARHFLPADCKEDAARCVAECDGRGADIVNARPPVARDRFPGRAAQCKERNARLPGSFRRIGGDPVGEGMGRVDEQVDVFFNQVINQSFDAAKSADPRRQGQGLRVDRPAGQRDGRRDVLALRQLFSQAAGLGRSAQNQDMVPAHG